jgi:hypothetical protein
VEPRYTANHQQIPPSIFYVGPLRRRRTEAEKRADEAKPKRRVISRKDRILKYYLETVLPDIENDRRDLVQLYFLTSNGYTKIGVSADTRQRIKQIEAHNPCVSLVAYIPGTHDFERYLHRAFKSSHLRNEWFRETDQMGDDLPPLILEGVKYGAERYGWPTAFQT